MMHCRICGRKSGGKRLCETCDYLLRQGGDEDTLRRMYSDDRTRGIWKENEAIAEELAQAYYDSCIENYPKSQAKRDSKENFGYNTFMDGIRLGLDIALPMLSPGMRAEVKGKIESMIRLRKSKRREAL